MEEREEEGVKSGQELHVELVFAMHLEENVLTVDEVTFTTDVLKCMSYISMNFKELTYY